MHINVYVFYFYFTLRQASSPCQRDIILLNLPQNLLIILQGLQSATWSIQKLLQRVTEKNAVLSLTRDRVPVEYKVFTWISVYMCRILQVLVCYIG